MAGVLYLKDVLELIVDTLQDGPFAQEELVHLVQQPVPHIRAQLGHQSTSVANLLNNRYSTIKIQFVYIFREAQL